MGRLHRTQARLDVLAALYTRSERLNHELARVARASARLRGETADLLEAASGFDWRRDIDGEVAESARDACEALQAALDEDDPPRQRDEMRLALARLAGMAYLALGGATLADLDAAMTRGGEITLSTDAMRAVAEAEQI